MRSSTGSISSISRWAEKKGLKKLFRAENLVVLILSGVLLFIVALPTKEAGGTGGLAEGTENTAGAIQTKFSAPDAGQPEETQKNGGSAENGQAFTEEAYAEAMEQKLTDILSDMADAGRVRVMITLKSSEELVVEKEEPVNRSATNESDVQGGSRIINQLETGDATVYRTDGSTSEPYVVKTLTPQIEGVLILAEGAGKGSVNQAMTEIVQALFGVEAHKVKVVRMETQTQSD